MTASGYRHGLNNDEKKNSSDNFEMHLELGGLEIIIRIIIAVVFIVFCSRIFIHGANSLFTV